MQFPWKTRTFASIGLFTLALLAVAAYTITVRATAVRVSVLPAASATLDGEGAAISQKREANGDLLLSTGDFELTVRGMQSVGTGSDLRHYHANFLLRSPAGVEIQFGPVHQTHCEPHDLRWTSLGAEEVPGTEPVLCEEFFSVGFVGCADLQQVQMQLPVEVAGENHVILLYYESQ